MLENLDQKQPAVSWMRCAADKLRLSAETDSLLAICLCLLMRLIIGNISQFVCKWLQMADSFSEAGCPTNWPVELSCNQKWLSKVEGVACSISGQPVGSTICNQSPTSWQNLQQQLPQHALYRIKKNIEQIDNVTINWHRTDTHTKRRQEAGRGTGGTG